ncbi:MAG: glycosyltransferase [Planctomycetaceae bacterium]
MHIVHLGKYYHPAVGGMESLIHAQAEAQVQSGHRVDVVAVNHITPAGKDVLDAALGVTSTIRESNGGLTVHRVGRFGNFAKFDLTTTLGATLRSIALEKPDIWHLHTPNATMVLGLRSLLKVCQPLIVTHHGDIINQRLLKSAYETAERRVYSKARVILSDSANYIDGSRQLQPHLSKVDVLPIGIDSRDYQNPSAEVLEWERGYRDQFGQPMWLCVGRLTPYKALEIAMQALVTTPGHLVVIGVGPCEQAWKQLAEQLRVADRVHWMGRCSDTQLRAAYRAATALWFPSNARNEGFGIVQIEAMASGCPVINTDIPHSGVSWVSQHDQTGYTVPVNDAASLSASACRLWEQPRLRQSFSVAARLRAARFDQETLNKKCMEIYRQAAVADLEQQ